MSSQARPALEFIPPHLNPVVVQLAKPIVPFWQHARTSISQIETQNVEVLAELFHQFQQGKTRFLMAFRHPSLYDPYCLSHLVWQSVPQAAKQQGIPLKQPIHSHFIYDRGIPLWAGRHMAWIYSKLGGTPIQRGKADWQGLKSARDLFANGQFPIAAAPEGATNGHNEIISNLEPGIAQLGFWCAEDLHKAGRTEEVAIVPIGIRYHYLTEPWPAIDKLLGELEIACGIETETSDRYQRLYQIGDRLLTQFEQFYHRFYHREIPPSSDLSTRLQTLLNTALEVAEDYFNISPKGNVIDRCRRLEQAGWNYIFRDDFPTLSPLEKGLANRIAEEANLRMWHMRLVETFVSVTGQYVLEKPTAERFAETTLLIWDTITRIKGGNPFKRPRLGKQRATITIGQPLSVSQHFPEYKSSRVAARQAVADLTQELQQSLEQLIVDSRD